jgi:acetylornithine deacetylase/succinyl-diaminopimelate desuccinylase-like protein
MRTPISRELRMQHPTNRASRNGAIERAVSELGSGSFETELARRISYRTESQKLPERLSDLEAYLTKEMTPAFEALGFVCRVYPNPVRQRGPVLLAQRVEDSKRCTILGYAHGDVIVGMDDRWTKGSGPWQLVRDGERFYGRGTADNKGQHTIVLSALRAVLAERGGTLGFNAKFVVETGEEVGSKGLAEVVSAHRAEFSADALIACDGPRVHAQRPTLTLGNRGCLNFDLVCDLREGAHHSGNWGGILADPTVMLAHALASMIGPSGELLVPELRTPAASQAVQQALERLEIVEDDDGPEIDRAWGEPHASLAHRLYGSNALIVLAAGAGTPGEPVNAIPGRAVAHCQLRYVAGTDPERVRPAIERHLGRLGLNAIRVADPPSSNDGRFAARRTEPDDPWAQWVAASLERTAGAPPLIVPQTGGSICNEVFTDVLGIPVIWIPHSHPACRQHAPDEHMLVSVVESGLALMAGLYWDLGEGDTPQKAARSG